MILRALVCTVLLGFTLVSVSCQTYRTRKVVFKNHPIALYVVNELIDEETIEYSVKFRNVGREVLSFDYTLADEAGVPHVDAEGPNSGLVENLYPGAEVKVENPMNTMKVWATLGKVTYGKRPKEELKGVYDAANTYTAPDLMNGGGGVIDGGLIPLPGGPNPSL